jgi:hypothetical protein
MRAGRGGWIGAVALAGLLTLGVLPGAQGATGPKPQVICVYANTMEPQGYYTRQPRKCIFHERGEPNSYASTLGVTGLRWRQWSYTSAYASGKALLNMTGPVPARVKLTHPVATCGHTVFSRAYFKLPDQFDGRPGWGDGIRLDIRVGRC